MTSEGYNAFLKNNAGRIVEKIIELDNFTDTDISFLKREIVSDINRGKKTPVAPLNEIRSLMVDYFAIRFIEEELEMTF